MLRSPPKLNCSSAMPRRWCAAPPCGCWRGLSRNGFPRLGGKGGGRETRWAEKRGGEADASVREEWAMALVSPPPTSDASGGDGSGVGGAHEPPLQAPPAPPTTPPT